MPEAGSPSDRAPLRNRLGVVERRAERLAVDLFSAIVVDQVVTQTEGEPLNWREAVSEIGAEGVAEPL